MFPLGGQGHIELMLAAVVVDADAIKIARNVTASLVWNH